VAVDRRVPSGAVRRPPPADLVLLGVAVLAVSTSAPLVRAADAPTLSIAFWRNALACVLLVPLVALRHRRAVEALTVRERRLALTAGVLLAAHFATWVPSLSFTSVASSVALVATQPVWAALMARAKGEVVPQQAWVGIFTAVLGAAVLSGVDLSISPRALFGDVLALAGGVLAAGYVTVGAEVRQTVSTTVYTTICYLTAAVLLFVVCLSGRQQLTGYDGNTWLCLVALTLGPQLLGHSLVNRVLKTVTPTIVSVAILFEIVGATVIAWIAFDEAPPAGAYPAALLIGIGVVLVVRSAREPAVVETLVVE
jgi:drug/metabolite transporter (DMT)-like permease